MVVDFYPCRMDGDIPMTGASKILALALSAALAMGIAQHEDTLDHSLNSYGLGSAKYLEGRTVFYSLFVDTPDKDWQQEERESALEELAIATDYLTEAALDYQREVEFVYDWQEHPNLTGNVAVDFSILDYDAFEGVLKEEINRWVEEQVDYEDCMQQYGAEGMAMLIFVNNPGISYSLVFDGMDNPKETIILFAKEQPAVYAHEILHVFGAHDLYDGEEYSAGVTSYVKQHYPLEIMYTVRDGQGRARQNEIVNVISPITAYQLGWLEDIPELEQFPQLARSKS